MRDFFESIVIKLKGFMYGRYGMDELSRALLITALVLFVISYLPFAGFLYVFSVVLIAWAYVRCLSKNIMARRTELAIYHRFKGRIRKKNSLRKKIWRERKTFRYFKCRRCKAYWRIPVGKGRVEITCRNCGTKMMKKT